MTDSSQASDDSNVSQWGAPSALDAHVVPYRQSGGGGGGGGDLKRRRVAPSAAASATAGAATAGGLPVTIITGFLGAGKSTLLNRILNNAQGVRVAVFVNELGKIDIDGSLVAMRSKVDETDVVLLNNGCVCCTINENLVAAVNAVLRRAEVSWLVIETTGAVDLLPLLDTFDWASEGETDLEGDVRVDSVITLVDATAFEHADFVECTAARNQILHADVLLLNKADLVSKDELAQLEARLQTMSIGRGAVAKKAAPILRCSFADAPLELLVDTAIFGRVASESSDTASTSSAAAEGDTSQRARRRHTRSSAPRSVTAGAGKVSHLGSQNSESEFSTVCFECLDRPLDPMRFEDFVEDGVPSCVYRAKGLVWLAGFKQQVVFQLAGRRTNPFEVAKPLLSAGPPTPSQQRQPPPLCTQLVFIGRGVDKHRERIYAALQACRVDDDHEKDSADTAASAGVARAP
jgi:G3E family GTPase